VRDQIGNRPDAARRIWNAPRTRHAYPPGAA
jgi:hypothetical protein